MVEDEAEVLTVVAAYIDLNPVRAGLAKDPKDYRWSGFGEAMGGGKRAQEGVVGLFPNIPGGYDRCMARYRTILYARGSGKKRGATDDKDAGCIDPETVEKVLAAGGKVSLSEALLCKWQYFSTGKVIGRKAFAEACAQAHCPEKRPRRALWQGFDLFHRHLED